MMPRHGPRRSPGGSVGRALAALESRLWATPLERLSGTSRAVVHAMRLLHMVLRELLAGDMGQRAASLVFTSLLALVPLLAVSFSVLKGFGVHNRMEVLLFNLLAPLGTQGQQFARSIVATVDRVEVGVLGGLGLLILVITVFGLVRKVEAALNRTWRVSVPRRLPARLAGYVSALLVGPLLVVAALVMELVQKLATGGPFAELAQVVPALLPYLLVLVAFLFAYQFMPSARVRPGAAVLGAAVGSGLWAAAGWAFSAFVVEPPASSYTAIYAGFAVVFFFILWLYVAWLILLLGGAVAFYFQHPEYLGVLPGEGHPSHRERERLALAVLARAGEAHRIGAAGPDTAALVRTLAVPAARLDAVVQALLELGLLARSARGGLLPAQDVDHLLVANVLERVRRHGDDGAPEVPDGAAASTALLEELEEAATRTLGERTVADLVGAAADPGDRSSLR